MTTARANAKLNLALVVGPRRDDGLHEVATVLQRLELADEIAIEPAPEISVEGFAEDTLVRAALEALADAASPRTSWKATIRKEIPVAAGLGGGSSDAATALRLANETLEEPLPPGELHDLAVDLGVDVPFFLAPGPQLGEGTGTDLTRPRAPAGLLGRARPPARRDQAVDRSRLRRLRRALRRGGLGGAARRPRRCACARGPSRATSRRFRPTISRRPRSPASS